MSKKESFIKGTIIIVVATLMVRVLSIVQRIPLEHIFGDVGNSAYGLANNVYLMLLTVASAGIPSTLSKMVSERYALNRPHEVNQIFRAALIFSIISGVLMSIFLYSIAPFYAEHIAKVPEASLAIRAIAPALLLFPCTAIMRGYFQGRGNMTVPAISQIGEQILRVMTSIGLALLLLGIGYSDKWLAAGASFGGVLGSVGAFGVMLYFTLKINKENRLVTASTSSNNGKAILIPYRQIYGDIFKLSIPIVLTSLAVTIVNFIDGSIVKLLLVGQIGEGEADQILAYLTSRAQMIAGIPPIIAIALSTSLIPVVSAAFTRKDEVHLRNQITLAMRISILTSIPIVLALATASYSVNGLLFKSPDGSNIVLLLTLMTIFQVTMMTSNSILLSIGKPNYSMLNVAIGIVVKLIGSYALSNIWGIYGIIVATGLCFLTITHLNLRMIKKMTSFSMMGKRWGGLIITIIIVSCVGYSLNRVGIRMVAILPDRIAFLLTCCVVAVAVFALYSLLLVLLKVIRPDDVAGFPASLKKLIDPLMKLQHKKKLSHL